MSLRSVVAALVVMMSLWARGAYADDLADARKAYKAGSQHFNLGEYDAALTSFKDAYRLREDPIFLFNIAQCQRLLKNKREALASYRTYLANAPRAPNRPEVERTIEQLKSDVVAEDEEKRRKEDAAAAAAAAAEQQRAAQQAQMVVAEPPQAPPPKTPLYKKWWLWTAVGGVVVVGLAVGLGVGLTRPGYPSAHTTDGTLHF
jgi:tetratricopeptide (TPR) repeat protein